MCCCITERCTPHRTASEAQAFLRFCNSLAAAAVFSAGGGKNGPCSRGIAPASSSGQVKELVLL